MFFSSKPLSSTPMSTASGLRSFALVFAVTLLTPLFILQAKAQSIHEKAKASITGADGTITGTASFFGNFTTISAPSGQAVGIAREADCSLNFYTGSYSLNTALTYTRTSITSNYDRTLHNHASLTTTPGTAYAAGCTTYPTGIGSRPGIFLGRTPTNINVFAGLNYSIYTMSNTLFFLTGLEGTVTGYGIQTYSFPTATTLATADLNGDHVGDLVISRGDGTTTGSISVAIGKTDGTFTLPAVTYPTGGSATVASVIDDFDGDGKPDIVSISNGTNYGDPQVISFLHGNGDGTFTAAININAPLTPGATSSASISNLASADLRGAGKKDIVCSNGLVLFNNTSTSNITPFVAASAVGFPYSIVTEGQGPNLALGDINKDGHSDIVVGTGNTVYTFLGKGDGTFTAGQSYDSIPSFGYVEINDLDGDGNPDIYVGLGNSGVFEGDNYFTYMSYALMGNGDGTFQGAYSGSGSYTGTNLGDINGDGFADLVSAPSAHINNDYSATFTVQLGNGKGAFTTASIVPQPVAFTLNGYSFPAGSLSTALIPTFAVGDIDGDGKADLVFVANNISVINPSNPGSSITYPYSVYFTAHSNGDGTFAAPIPHSFPQIAPAADFDIQLAVTNLHLVDVTHDGKLDIVASYNDTAGTSAGQPAINPYQQGLAVLSGTGTGTFSTSPILTSTYSSTTASNTGIVPYVVGISDLNGDGKPDLIVYNSTFALVSGAGVSTATYSSYFGNGDGTFAAPAVLATAAKLNSLAIADFNKDGHPDIAYIAEAGNASQATINIILNNGSGGVGNGYYYYISGGDAAFLGGLAAADFDGDGKVDIALIGSEIISGVYYGKGDGELSDVVANSTAYPTDLINIAGGGTTTAVDLNNDGKPDIFTGSTVLLNVYGSAPSLLATTTTTLTANASTIPTNGSVILTATIASSTAGVPTGTVKFLDGSNSLALVTLASGTASATINNFVVGSHSITAVYSGDTTYASSTSTATALTVTAAIPTVATTTTLTASASTVLSGANVSFSVIVSPTTGSAIPAGTVTFKDGFAAIGSASLDATGKTTFSTAALVVGSHSITASYSGGTTTAAIFTASTTSAISITVTPPGFTLALSAATSTVTRGSAVSTNLSITPVGGFNTAVTLTCTGAPSGSTCTISPALVTLNGTTASTAVVTLQTSATASVTRAPSNILFGLLGFPIFLGIGLSFTRFRQHGFKLLVFTLIAVLFTASGCGKNNPDAPATGTPATGSQNDNLTISASSPAATTGPQSINWGVTVQ